MIFDETCHGLCLKKGKVLQPNEGLVYFLSSEGDPLGVSRFHHSSLISTTSDRTPSTPKNGPF